MSRPRALIAEDEEPQRAKLCELLRELWPELEIVAECDDGLGALEAMTSLQPETAFLDIRMPGLSGLEIAQAAGPGVHIVFTTAYDEYAVRAFERGAIDYLLKPVSRDRLATSVARLKERIGSTAAPPSMAPVLEALDPEEFWRIHRSVIVRAAAIHRIEADGDGALQLRVRGRDELLPVSSAFQYRFRPM